MVDSVDLLRRAWPLLVAGHAHQAGATDTAVWLVEIEPGAPATPHSLTPRGRALRDGRRRARLADGTCITRPVELTTRGRRLLETVEQIDRELETEWAALIGEPAVERIRHDRADVLTRAHDGTLPPVRPTW
jgi:hypothetical protein